MNNLQQLVKQSEQSKSLRGKTRNIFKKIRVFGSYNFPAKAGCRKISDFGSFKQV